MATYNIEQVRKAIGNVEGKSADEVKALIMTKGKVTFGDVPKVYKALGFVTVRKTWASEFYALLEDGPMDADAFEDWINAGSKNVKAHKSHYNAIREMANRIHAAK